VLCIVCRNSRIWTKSIKNCFRLRQSNSDSQECISEFEFASEWSIITWVYLVMRIPANDCHVAPPQSPKKSSKFAVFTIHIGTAIKISYLRELRSGFWKVSINPICCIPAKPGPLLGALAKKTWRERGIDKFVAEHLSVWSLWGP